MIKIKLFEVSSETIIVEKMIQEWFNQNKEIVIKHVCMSQSQDGNKITRIVLIIYI